MIGNHEIYLRDLKENKQKEVLETLGIKNEAEGNLDITPLFILETFEDTDNSKDNNESPFGQD